MCQTIRQKLWVRQVRARRQVRDAFSKQETVPYLAAPLYTNSRSKINEWLGGQTFTVLLFYFSRSVVIYPSRFLREATVWYFYSSLVYGLEFLLYLFQRFVNFSSFFYGVDFHLSFFF